MDMSYDNQSPWSYELVRTRDGARQGRVTPTGGGTWARRLDGKSAGSHEFHLAEDPEVWARMRPARRTLVVCYDGDPVYAGVIWAARYDRTAGTVTLTHEDIWSVWERRFAIPQWHAWNASEDVIETSVTYSGFSRTTHVKRVIELGLRGPSGFVHSYELPLLFPSETTGNRAYTWRAFEFLTVEDAIKKVGAQGGPMQVDFPPSWSSNGSLRWYMQVSHASPPAGPIHLHPEAPDSAVINLTYDHDMTDYASEFQITGSGQDADTLHRYHWLGDVGGDLVALAMQYSDGTIDSDSELITVRDGLAERHRVATVQADMTVAIGGENGLTPHDFTLGQRIQVHLNDDPVIPRVDGGHTFMLIGYSPAGHGALRLELAPVDGYTGYNTGEPSMHYRNLNTSRVQDLYERIHRAEKRLVYPRGGATAAATTSREDT